MLSLGSQLSQIDNTSVVHSLVDSFFEGKKALIKERLMDSMRQIVDGLFEEMVGQVKEMLLPPKKNPVCAGKSDGYKAKKNKSPVKKAGSSSAGKSPQKSPSSPKRQSRQNSTLVYAVKSKPGPSKSSHSPSSTPAVVPSKRILSFENGLTTSRHCDTPSTSGMLCKKVKISSGDDLVNDKFEDDDEIEEANDDTDNDDDDGGGGTSSIEKPHLNKQPKQSLQKKVSCPEPSCDKLVLSVNLKRHLRSHRKLKPFACTYEGCTYQTEYRSDALRHIKSVHLKKKKKNAEAEGDEDEEEDEEEDPTTYLRVKKELL